MQIKNVFERQENIVHSADGVVVTKTNLSKPQHLSTAWLEIRITSNYGFEKNAGTKINKEEAVKLIEALKEVVDKYPNINIIALGGIINDEQIKEMSKTKAYGIASIRYFV